MPKSCIPTPVRICHIMILNNSHHGDLNLLPQVDPVPLLFHFRVVFFWFPWGSTTLETSTEPRRCFLMLDTNKRDIPESALMTTSRRQIGQWDLCCRCRTTRQRIQKTCPHCNRTNS